MASSLSTIMKENVQVKAKRAKRPHRPLGLLTNEKESNICFVKREKTLRKMASQLSSRCQVNVCFMCFGQDGWSSWPENHQEVEAMINTYRGSKNVAKKYNLSSYISLQKIKKKEKISKLEVDESTKLTNYWEKRIEQMRNEEVVGALNLLNAKLLSAKERMAILIEKKQMASQNCPSTQHVYHGTTDIGNAYSSIVHASTMFDQNSGGYVYDMCNDVGTSNNILGWEFSRSYNNIHQRFDSSGIGRSSHTMQSFLGPCMQPGNIVDQLSLRGNNDFQFQAGTNNLQIHAGNDAYNTLFRNNHHGMKIENNFFENPVFEKDLFWQDFIRSNSNHSG